MTRPELVARLVRGGRLVLFEVARLACGEPVESDPKPLC
jgi:hypothetical protein